jgi:hypothetical protein
MDGMPVNAERPLWITLGAHVQEATPVCYSLVVGCYCWARQELRQGRNGGIRIDRLSPIDPLRHVGITTGYPVITSVVMRW